MKKLLYFFAITLLITLLFSCNNENSKKEKNQGNKTDTLKSGDSVAKNNNLQKITLTPLDDSNSTFSVLDLSNTSQQSSINTFIFKLKYEDLKKILQFNKRKQVYFYFDQDIDGSYYLYACGNDKDGKPLSKNYFPEKIKDTILNNVALRIQKLTRGELRKFLHPGSNPGPIDTSKIKDLYLIPFVNQNGIIQFNISINYPLKKPIGAMATIETNPIPPARPACENLCDD
jgi:hypothetical protein